MSDVEVTGHLLDMPPIDYFDDEEIVAAPATIERLSKLAVDAVALQKEVDEESVALEDKKAKLDKILSRQIPDIMLELSMQQFKMIDGTVIDAKADIRASITVENRLAAWEWLEKNQFDGIIKTKVVSEFGRGELDEAQKAMEELVKLGFEAALDRNVHPATLKSFVKERLAEADSEHPFPRDIFSVYEFTTAKIKLPKVKK